MARIDTVSLMPTSAITEPRQPGIGSLVLPPNAAALIESMRDIGYSLETALADVLDNSISAEATRVDILFDPDPQSPMLAVVDNGRGMAATELIEAMRPGSRNPREVRHAADLGRFGLGLKTASFSQCRRLTVVSRQNGEIHAARWDLDFVQETGEWLLQVPPAFEIGALPHVDRLGTTGTLILWEKLDRLGDEADSAAFRTHAYRKMDGVCTHLELVFHRFLEGERSIPKVVIAVNNRALAPFDPFNVKNKATQRLPEERIRLAAGDVLVEPFILPHHKMVSAAEWERYGGETGYLRNQGFYLYRAGRLIIHGTWFRLAKQTELTRLARVRIDIPNGLDAAWKIDVRKASAQPPYRVRERLRSIIQQITGSAGRVYTARGRRLTADVAQPFWHRQADKGNISYVLNREHPVVQSFVDELPEGMNEDFVVLMQAFERSFPIDSVFSDVAGNPTALDHDPMTEADMKVLVRVAMRSFLRAGVSLDDAKRQLERAEPWKSNWKVATRLLDDAYRNDGQNDD